MWLTLLDSDLQPIWASTTSAALKPKPRCTGSCTCCHHVVLSSRWYQYHLTSRKLQTSNHQILNHTNGCYFIWSIVKLSPRKYLLASTRLFWWPASGAYNVNPPELDHLFDAGPNKGHEKEPSIWERYVRETRQHNFQYLALFMMNIHEYPDSVGNSSHV